MPDLSKMKVKKLSRKSFKSNKGLKKKRKSLKSNEEKAKQLQSKSAKPEEEESSDESVGLSDDELDKLVDSDTEPSLPTRGTNDKNKDVDYFERSHDASESSGDDDDDDDDDEGLKHKHALEKLKDTDPDFYKFLKENDQKLLKFDVSGSESEGEEGEDVEGTHRPPDELQGDSEESDFEEETGKSKGAGNVVTLQMVSNWREQLATDVTVELLTDVVSVFHAALQRVSGDEETESSEYRVDGSSVFNAVIQMCVLELQPALMKFLKLPKRRIVRSQPGKAKRFIKIKSILKCYLADLLKLLGGVTSTHILSVLLKHLHQMTGFLGYYQKQTRVAIRKLVNLWSTGEETVRVIAFLCILRLTTNQQKSLLDSVLKLMYVKYISNSKFVSVQTLPAITFMRRSLAEMFALDSSVSYQHAFLYIRQLAIHLRNAITLKKQESIQSVCNWQYINSVKLWIDLICSSVDKDKGQLQALLYPIVQIIIGCIKLVPTAQYIPLRFHYCELLVRLSKETGTFIPILPLVIEALAIVDFNKRHKKVSMKPMDFTCVFRVSKTGLVENGFKDAIVENVYQLLLEYVATESFRMSFPDVMVPAVIQLRTFLKSCRMSKYTQKMKHLVTKIEETSKFIESERRKVSIELSDRKSVEAWEYNIKNKGTPLLTFYTSWKKVHVQQMAKRATNNDKLGEFNLPVLKKRTAKKEDDEGPVELFPSDESDDDQMNFGDEDDGEPSAKKSKRPNKEKQKVKEVKTVEKQIEDDSENESIEDIVEDFKLSDFE